MAADPEAREALTARQRDVLDVIKAGIAAHGYPPSQREIGAAVGVCPKQVRSHLDGLQYKGYIRRVLGRGRSIKVVDRA